MPESMNGMTSSEYGVVGVDTAAIHAEPDCLEAQAHAHDAVAADAIGERAGDRRHEDRHRGPRQDPQPGLERRVALHGLEELREQEDRAEHPEEHEERRDVRVTERPVLEEAHRQHRLLRPELPEDERGHEHRARDEREHDLRARPALAVAADEAPDDAEEAGADEREPAQVEARRGPRASPRGAATRAA